MYEEGPRTNVAALTYGREDQMASDERQLSHRARAIRIPLLALAAALLALAALAAPAGAEVVYDNPAAAEAPTLNFAESGAAELGSLVRLAGTDRLDPVVRVGMANSGAEVAVPITLSLYSVAAGGEPGALLARVTQSFELAEADCVQPVEFDLAGVTLPDEAIVSVAFDSDAVGVALAGPAATGASPREAEGVYRAASDDGGGAPVFGFEAAPAIWEGRQPAFTVEAAAAPPPVVAPPAAAPTAAPSAAPTATAPTPTATATATALSAPRAARREYRIPASKRMTLSFTRATARIAGPGALVQVRCTGSSAARCIGTISLTAAGGVHKAPYSIGKGRRQYVVVPLGSDRRLLDRLETARATATASTVQVGGAAVRTKRALKLK